MAADRRTFLAAALATTGLGASGCARGPAAAARVTRLDADRLAQGFAGLAARARPGSVSLAVAPLAGGAAWCADPQGRYPMDGIVHLAAAAAALAQIDAGRLTLGERIRITAADLGPPPSRINALFPPPAGANAFDIPLADLIALAIQDGDDTAADAVMRRLGGPQAVAGWLQARGLADMRIDRYARETRAAAVGLEGFDRPWADAAAWAAAAAGVPAQVREAAVAARLADPRDTTTAPAALALLTGLAGGGLLARGSTAFLIDLMGASKPGPHRLRAGLPAGARLAHVAGTSVTVIGLTAATNDIGLVRLADGRALAVAALLSGSTATETQRDLVIADAARLSISSLA